MKKSYKNLIVWQKAHQLVKGIYLVSKKFPSEELYGITSQLRRASVSVPTNIVEGCARRSRQQYRQFINIALGSLAEAEYLMELSAELGFMNKDTFDKLEIIRAEVGAMLWSLYNSL